MKFSKKLFIHQLPKEEVRRGWVKIEESTRNKIKSGSLILIKCGEHKTRRIVIGTEKNEENKIFMDEPTREELNFFGEIPKKEYEFEIIKPSWFCKWCYHAPIFYWNHPDFPVNFSSKLALLSLIISTISIIISRILK